MSAQRVTHASHFVSTESESAACLNDWPLLGWRLIASPSTLRYVRLQQRAEHLETRHVDLALALRRLRAQQEKGIDHAHTIARLERITDRARFRVNVALGELFAEDDRLRGVSEEA